MSSFLIILLACALYGFLHSLLASLWVKERLRRLFGEDFFRWYRLIYNLIVSLTFVPVLGLLALLPDRTLYVIPFPWVLFTGAVQLVALGVIALGLLQSGLVAFLGLDALFGRSAAPEKLTLSGLYAWVRHPIYTAGLVFLWLTPVLTQNLLAFNLGLTIYIFIGAWLEERKLIAQFGEVYRRYQQQVPMFLPYRIPK
ncbi:MAG: isoprenylcysteine carboxylmethyltransferase family protein [Anaerolineales bacterium]|nr:isoprenylcysteine carboxylmethyltransferase family protein [Anaerolineales bacterium]MDW8447479.1 isoprenylcysteine carboxylmethyltransferase family protein [Anaerolineales bacterium]